MSPYLGKVIFRGALVCLVVCSTPLGYAQDQAETESKPPIVIAVAGDTLPEPYWRPQNKIDTFMDGMRAEFARADLVFLNHEQPITSSKKATPFKDPALVKAKKDYILRATNPGIPQMLKDAGVGLVGLANNHMMDYMEAGLKDTQQYFQAAGLPFVGAGLKRDAERAFVFEKDCRRIALLAFSDVVPIGAKATETSPGIASAKNEQDLTVAIQAARKEADFVILMIHWGGQGSHQVLPRQRLLARLAIEAGCDVVMGMHPHVLQGIEYIGEKPVFYSLGNFAMASSVQAQRETVLVRLLFGQSKLEGVELVPVFASSDGAPQVAEGKQAAEILSGLDKLCWRFNSQIKGGRLEMGPVRESLKPKAARRPKSKSAPKGA
ncbi:MAG: CapA family protein, partial [Acidobacteria bacterium]|nr:CapA family protein [Acidobacteriota bacterium]